MSLTADQITALAPDAASAAAGRKLASLRDWKNLGHNDAALWGDCQGSALYGVSVDLSDLTCRCTCPSRKFPCKHGLGLLLLHAAGSVPRSEAPPERTTTWLAGREARAAKKAEAPPATAEQVAKRAAKAEAKLADLALGPFTLWLEDVARAGLASLERDGGKQLQREAARLVDVSAPGLAARCRELAEQVGAGAGWAEVVLAGLGELRLLTAAVERSEQLSEALRADLRAAVGVPVTQDEVRLSGPREAGRWLVGGAVTFSDPVGLKVRRTWLLRADDPGVHALILDFAPAAAPLPVGLLPGSTLEATLARWPGASGQRALIVERGEATGPRPEGLAIAAALAAATEAFARVPWVRTAPLLLAGVQLVVGAEVWLRDAAGDGLRIAQLPETLLAVAGSDLFTVAVEWDGAFATPLTAWVGDALVVTDAPPPPPSARALTGLARIALPGGDGALPATPVDAAVPEAPRPRRILWLAGAMAAWARAGARPGHPGVPVPSPPETRPEAPPGVHDALRIGGDSIAPEVFRRVDAHGMRLGFAALPEVLSAGRHRRLARAVLGERGRWLASQREAWSWAITADTPVDIETLATPAARRDALLTLRRDDPDAARAVLARLLPTEKADRRAELLSDLLDAATPEDLPLARAFRADRSAIVAGIADQICLRLGEDPHAEAVRRRVTAAIRAQADTGWLSRVGLGKKPTLIVDLPAAEDPSWEADGLPKLPAAAGKPTTGMDRLRWLLGRTPPRALAAHTSMAPGAFLAAFPSEYADALLAVADAAIRDQDAAWIEALHAHAGIEPATRQRLRLALPAEAQFALAVREVGERAEGAWIEAARLQQLPTPWPRALTAAVAARAEAEDAAQPGYSTPLGPPLVTGCADADLPRIAALPNLGPAAAATLKARLLLSQLLPEPAGAPPRSSPPLT